MDKNKLQEKLEMFQTQIDDLEQLDYAYNSTDWEGYETEEKETKNELDKKTIELEEQIEKYNKEIENLSFEERCTTPIIYYDSVLRNKYVIENPSFTREEINKELEIVPSQIREEFENKLDCLDKLNSEYNIGFSSGGISFETASNDKKFIISEILAGQELCNNNAKEICIDFKTGNYRCYSDSVRTDWVIDANGTDEKLIDARLTKKAEKEIAELDIE